jgi:hypothetical protein|tara:strand:- start:3242 stop:3679 length:438 start_codon:yes stop_codon:yes gene_type:complete
MAKKEQKPVLYKMQNLKNLGNKILAGKQLKPEELKYIGEVFVLIGDGADPYEVLDIKGTGGWNSKKNEAEKCRLNQVVLTLGWIEQAMKPEPDGHGYGLSEAIRHISIESNPKREFTEDNLNKLWSRYTELRGKPMTLLDLQLLD